MPSSDSGPSALPSTASLLSSYPSSRPSSPPSSPSPLSSPALPPSSPPTSTSTSHAPITLRRRRLSLPSPRSSRSKDSPTGASATVPGSMFSSRKYTPLPTNAEGHRRKRVGGLAAWKRYAAIAAIAALVIVIGYSSVGGSSKDLAVNGECAGGHGTGSCV